MSEKKTLLSVNDIHVYYGPIHAIKGISFEVKEGEIVALIGANGAGKSTTLKTISGTTHPKTGSVIYTEKKGGVPVPPPFRKISSPTAAVPSG